MRDRKANEDALDQLLTAWTATRNKWEVTRTLQAVGVAAFPTMNCKDLAEDAHLNAREFFARLAHPEIGVQTHTGIPWRLHNAPNGVQSPAPMLGQHTDYVMRELLNYSEQKIMQLKEEKILY
jgi:crotonobetainyl-CoA:carnitine CoA-transferase CaiB-like acyl-CoA transferase